MINQHYEDVLFDIDDALIHDAYTGFKEDYLIVHSLLRRYKPKSILETGTNIGSGVNVIHRAIPNAKIYSLDLDFETMCGNSKQYPVENISIGGGMIDRVGTAATVPYTQLRGDSLTFDFNKYPVEAAFIDSEHDTEHPYMETMRILAHKPKIIIYHDADMQEVFTGIMLAWLQVKDEYMIYRVRGTRIAYLLRDDLV